MKHLYPLHVELSTFMFNDHSTRLLESFRPTRIASGLLSARRAEIDQRHGALTGRTIGPLKAGGELEEQMATGRRGDDGFVFAKPDGSPIHPDLISQTFQRTVETLDVTRIRLHDLRHTHASILLQAGVPVKVVSERLGHSSPAFTITVYQHVMPGMQAEAAATFSAAVFGES